MMSVYGKLKQFAFDRLFVASGKRDELGKVHNLQQDFDSCSMFAFDHAVQLSKRDIYSDLEKLVGDNCQRRGYTTVYWEQLPIQLVWNAQSLNFFTNYLEVNKNKLTQGELKAYKKYIKKNTELDAKKKSRNVAVDRIFDSSLKQIFPWVEKLSQTEIDYIAGEDTYLMPMQRESTFVFANNNAFFKSCKIRKKVSANSPRVFESSSSLLGELVRYQTLLQS